METLKPITEVWLIYSPESDVLVPSDQFARKLEDAKIVKVRKLEIKGSLVKYILDTPITIDVARLIHQKLKTENFIVQEFTHIENTVRFRLF